MEPVNFRMRNRNDLIVRIGGHQTAGRIRDFDVISPLGDMHGLTGLAHICRHPKGSSLQPLASRRFPRQIERRIEPLLPVIVLLLRRCTDRFPDEVRSGNRERFANHRGRERQVIAIAASRQELRNFSVSRHGLPATDALCSLCGNGQVLQAVLSRFQSRAMIARESMRRGSKSADGRVGGSNGYRQSGGRLALEGSVQVAERLLHDAPGGHVRLIVPVANDFNGHDGRKCQQEENTAGMHRDLRGPGVGSPYWFDEAMRRKGLGNLPGMVVRLGRLGYSLCQWLTSTATSSPGSMMAPSHSKKRYRWPKWPSRMALPMWWVRPTPTANTSSIAISCASGETSCSRD